MFFAQEYQPKVTRVWYARWERGKILGEIANFPTLSQGDQDSRRFAEVNEDPYKMSVTRMDTSRVWHATRETQGPDGTITSLEVTDCASSGLLAENRRKRRFLLHEFVIMPNHFHLLLTPAAEIPLEKALPFIKGRFLLSRETGNSFCFRNMASKFRESPRSRRRGLQTPPHLHLESGQSGLERETGAVCLVIGVSGDGIGRPATRAKALSLYTGTFSRV
jgi:hypothetical protein